MAELHRGVAALQALEADPGNQDLLDIVGGVLLDCCDDANSRESLVQHGGIPVLAQVIHGNAPALNLQIGAYQLLNIVVCQHPEYAQTVGVEAILATMNHHTAEAYLQQLALGLLTICAIDDAQAQQIVDQGGIATILAAIQARDGGASPVLAANACVVLGSLAFRHNRQVAQAGGIELIVAIVTVGQPYPAVADVQEPVCSLLGCLAMGGENSAVEIAQAGGVAVIVAAVHACPIRALWALEILAQTPATGQQIQQAITQTGGVPAIMAAVGVHLTEPLAHVPVVRALLALACNPNIGQQLQRDIAGAGVVGAVVEAVDAHPDSDMLWALGTLARNRDIGQEIQVDIAQAGGVAVIVAAVRAHPDTRVERNGRELLATLAENPVIAEEIAAQGYIFLQE